MDGKPLYLHNVQYASESKLIKDVYVSTNIELIKSNSFEYGYHVIDRPEELCEDKASHYDAILHGLSHIEESRDCDILVILLGNSNGALTADLDKALEIIIADPTIDSVQSVNKFNMFNPFRAFYKSSSGLLKTWIPNDEIEKSAKLKNINDKDSSGDIYFFNGSFMIVRKEILLRKDGLQPFAWMGQKIYPFEQECLKMEVDAQWQLDYLLSTYR